MSVPAAPAAADTSEESFEPEPSRWQAALACTCCVPTVRSAGGDVCVCVGGGGGGGGVTFVIIRFI